MAAARANQPEPMDRATIYTLTLLKLGNYEYEEGSPPALACERLFPHVMRRANAWYDWSFCNVRKRIPGDRKKDYGGGRYVYPLPHGLLKLKQILTLDGFRKIKEPELVATGITVGEDGADGIMIDYQADLVGVAGELPDNNPDFCEATIALLASHLAMNITGRYDLGQNLAQEAQQFFARAIAHDKQQDWSNDKDPMTLLRKNNFLR